MTNINTRSQNILAQQGVSKSKNVKNGLVIDEKQRDLSLGGMETRDSYYTEAKIQQSLDQIAAIGKSIVKPVEAKHEIAENVKSVTKDKNNGIGISFDENGWIQLCPDGTLILSPQELQANEAYTIYKTNITNENNFEITDRNGNTIKCINGVIFDENNKLFASLERTEHGFNILDKNGEGFIECESITEPEKFVGFITHKNYATGTAWGPNEKFTPEDLEFTALLIACRDLL